APSSAPPRGGAGQRNEQGRQREATAGGGGVRAAPVLPDFAPEFALPEMLGRQHSWAHEQAATAGRKVGERSAGSAATRARGLPVADVGRHPYRRAAEDPGRRRGLAA